MSEIDFNNVLDIDHLILEVKKRPNLYDRKSNQFYNRSLKEKLWVEVCTNVVLNWNGFSDDEKEVLGKEVQKKWRNLKDCFTKELTRQRTYGQSKRKYVHYKELSFLIPYTQEQPTSSTSEGPVETEIQKIDAETEKVGVDAFRRYKKAFLPKIKPRGDTLVEILNKQKKDELDEDRKFAQMLVPMFKNLNEDQKHYARIEILNALHTAKQS
ncbi:uncharacterized protein LOC143918551 [Arctopsyche grandis]|uniref:uncharacterized protein LOC143918551 n=1 Tax=Arctopsyche grandis TaxID=121162 RepID=UPI00406D74BE